jgi:hypothetical protein
MVMDELVELVEQLAEKTSSGTITWHKDPEEIPDRFWLDFGQYSLVIYETYPDQGEEAPPDIWIGIHDRTGARLDEFSDRDLMGALSNAFRTMNQLFKDARTSANGTKGAIKSILDALRTDQDEIPF